MLLGWAGLQVEVFFQLLPQFIHIFSCVAPPHHYSHRFYRATNRMEVNLFSLQLRKLSNPSVFNTDILEILWERPLLKKDEEGLWLLLMVKGEFHRKRYHNVGFADIKIQPYCIVHS